MKKKRCNKSIPSNHRHCSLPQQHLRVQHHPCDAVPHGFVVPSGLFFDLAAHGCGYVDAREVVVVVAMALKQPKNPPPAHVWMQGRWWWQTRRDVEKIHLWLAFGREGGGGGGKCVEMSKKSTSSLRVMEFENGFEDMGHNLISQRLTL
jgi:hypothetical protein